MMMFFRKPLRWAFFSFLSATIPFSPSCHGNIIQEFTNKRTDDALYQSAQIKINSFNWDGAIADFKAISSPYYIPSNRSRLFLRASAYAGKCGFNFADFFGSISKIKIDSASPLFLALMQMFQGKTVALSISETTVPALATDPTTNDYCAFAQNDMDLIQSTFGPWNSDENMFVLLFSLGKIGIILHNFVDKTNSGAVSPLFDGCNRRLVESSSNALGMTDFYVVQLVTGFSLFLQNFSRMFPPPTGGDSNCPAPVGSGTSSAVYCIMAGFAKICELAGYTFCSTTSPKSVSTSDILNMRGVLTATSSAIGIGLFGLARSSGPNASVDPGVTVSNGAWNCDPIPSGGLIGCCRGNASSQTYPYP